MNTCNAAIKTHNHRLFPLIFIIFNNTRRWVRSACRSICYPPGKSINTSSLIVAQHYCICSDNVACYKIRIKTGSKKVPDVSLSHPGHLQMFSLLHDLKIPCTLHLKGLNQQFSILWLVIETYECSNIKFSVAWYCMSKICTQM